jgi:transketolase
VKLGGTRAAGRDVLQPLAAELPLLIGGSADLYGSTLNYIAPTRTSTQNRSGRNIRFGIREHGMAAIANGVAYDGLFRPSIATFLVFADYSRPRCGWPRSRSCRSSTSTPTTRSASARTARPTSPSRRSPPCG